MACITQLVFFLFGHGQLGGEGAIAHAGAVGLHDADGKIQLVAGNACADGGISADHIGGGGVGINAEINIAQRAQLSLEQDLFALAVCLVQIVACIADVILKDLGVLLAPCPHFFQIGGLGVVAALHHQILAFHDGGKAALHIFVQMQKIAHAQGLLHVFIGIAISNAALGRAKLCAGFGKALFLQTVLLYMERHADSGAVRNFQVCRADLNALFAQVGNLTVQMVRINEHTIAHHAHDLRAQNAAGQQVQHKLAARIFHRVASVVAALIAHNNVIILAEQVDHAALAFIAPVDACNCSKHNNTSSKNPKGSLFRAPCPGSATFVIFSPCWGAAEKAAVLAVFPHTLSL